MTWPVADMLRPALAASMLLALAVSFPFLYGVAVLHAPTALATAAVAILPLDAVPDVWPSTLLLGGAAWGFLVARLAGRPDRIRFAAAAGLAVGPATAALTLGSLHEAIGLLAPPRTVEWFVTAMFVLTGQVAFLTGIALGLAAGRPTVALRLGILGGIATAVPATAVVATLAAVGLRIGSGGGAMAHISAAALLLATTIGGTVLAVSFATSVGNGSFRPIVESGNGSRARGVVESTPAPSVRSLSRGDTMTHEVSGTSARSFRPFGRAGPLVLALALANALVTSCTSSPSPPERSPTQVPTSVPPTSGTPGASLGVAPRLDGLQGELVYSVFSGTGKVYLRDLETTKERQIAAFPRRGAQQFAWSHDGKRLAMYTGVDVQTRETDVVVMNRDGSHVINLTADQALGNCTSPSWSPDDRTIAFTCVPAPDNPLEVGATPPHLYLAAADGSEPPTQLTDFWAQSPSWSPDGSKIAFQAWVGPFPTSKQSQQAAEEAKSNYEIYVMSANGTETHRLTDTPQDDQRPEWSPDGMHIAFDSERDTTDDSSSLRVDGPFSTPSQIYVMNPDGSGATRITNDTGQEQVRPRWIRKDLVAFYFVRYAGLIEGIAFVRPSGSATVEVVGPYGSFDIHLTGP